MPGANPAENEFFDQLNSAIESNLSNSQFGVEELADLMNMSRSNLLRKVKKLTGLSVTQMISERRLEKALELLKSSSFNVTEIAEKAGFGSSSYFIKVFREKYGYSPGRIEQQNIEHRTAEPKKFRWAIILSVAAIIIGAGVIFLLPKSKPKTKDLSIAVLPFKNESSDSTNVYLINGLMESTLNNLQQIPDLRVISRTTSEKYRETKKSIPEMGKELNVGYFIEGSGQKIGDKILLNIQLIEAATDKHLWAKQYRRETRDIFELQHEIAKNIADEIEVVITPEAEKRITQKPTNNLVAYDYYLKGRELFYRSGPGDLYEAAHNFSKAVEYDSTFALAYATSAMVHYYLDMFMAEKKYTNVLEDYADKAIRFDPKLSDSYIAKGLALASKKEYSDAVKYLEKAHELAPKHGLPLHFLTEFYSIHVFNTAKYLEYALIAVKIDQESPVDSATTSFKYFHLSSAFASAGFIDEGQMYVNKSLDFNPGNPFAKYFKVYIELAKDGDVRKAREHMVSIYKQDTMRLDIVQEVAKLYVMEHDYKNAYKAYSTLNYLMKLYNVRIYEGEGIRMALAWKGVGDNKQAEKYIEEFREYGEHDETIYRHLNIAMYNIYKGNQEVAFREFARFLDEDHNYHYWTLFMSKEPYIDPVRNTPEYKRLYKRMEGDFWENSRQTRKLLEGKGLL
jgi:TolB-like protein/AraC-like DNA-binding protein